MKCAKIGCENDGIYVPELLLRSYPEQEEPAVVQVGGIRVCHDCSRSALVSHFITPASWDTICDGIVSQGKPRPLAALTKLAWTRDAATPDDSVI